MQTSRKWQLNETCRAAIGAFQRSRVEDKILFNFLFDPIAWSLEGVGDDGL